MLLPELNQTTADLEDRLTDNVNDLTLEDQLMRQNLDYEIGAIWDAVNGNVVHIIRFIAIWTIYLHFCYTCVPKTLKCTSYIIYRNST